MKPKAAKNYHRFTHAAMGTVFEIKISHDDYQYAKFASTEAFRLLDTLEQYLSRFIANSDISRISNLEIGEWTKVSVETYECLMQCVDMYRLSAGVFDVSIGALYDCWLDEKKRLKSPTPDEIAEAKEHVGLHKLSFDATQFRVGMSGGPVHLDLGGFGKGYALDKMAELLTEWELTSFVLNGGQSSMLFRQPPAGEAGWDITLSDPFNDYQPMRELRLHNVAIAGSGLQKGRHIIDPRSGEPLQNHRATWALAPTAAFADGLSTTFMILEYEKIKAICATMPQYKAIILDDGAGRLEERLQVYGDI
ncbi:hypothetical protein DRI50_11330 [candidate division KSB1 bacterium]|nr:MAG: hypothetical protein DRI50_11330 [candidate division KSB1 bacterium]